MSDATGPREDFDIDRDIEQEPADASEGYAKMSPWPVFVALGFGLSEVGIVLGLFPVAVGGLVLFGGTAAAVLREAGYTGRAWGTVLGLGLVLVALGALLVAGFGETTAPAGLLDPANSVAYRGSSVVVAGILLAAVGGTLRIAGRNPGSAGV